MSSEKIYLYDSTLRDGGQTSSVDFTVQNKIDLAKKLDSLGVDYIEAGWPGANPTDSEFFENIPDLANSKIVAFGMTKKLVAGDNNYSGLDQLIVPGVKHITLVGKCSDFHVKEALKISKEDNLEMVSGSIKYLVEKDIEVIFDAEHFFDGFKSDAEYAIEVVKTAHESGAKWVALCDTNGGTLPHEITEMINKLTPHVAAKYLSIHCHNDTGNAVANTIAAVCCGVRHIQGALNGLGERCGNANFTSLIPILKIKMGYDISVSDENLKQLKHVSNYLCDMLNQAYNAYAPFVGQSAFSHKGGLHASAMVKNSKSYEHMDPHLVGNVRNILVSDQAGRASIISKLLELKINFDVKDPKINDLIAEVKRKESKGYSYDSADASFYLLAQRILSILPVFFEFESYKIIDEKRHNANGELVTISEAIVRVKIAGKIIKNVAEGNGPVDALDRCFRKLLTEYYPEIEDCHLSDYKVRILNPDAATAALIRVLIATSDSNGNRWVSVGVATDVIDASYIAMQDAINYRLLRSRNIK